MRKYARHQVQDLNNPYRAVGRGGDEWLQPRQYFWGRGHIFIQQPRALEQEGVWQMQKKFQP